jgi:hypothetical protein
VAFEASDELQLKVALNLDWASLGVDPMPAASPTFDPGTGTAHLSRVVAADGAWGFGFQAGLILEATDALNVGLSSASPPWFQNLEDNVLSLAAGWRDP